MVKLKASSLLETIISTLIISIVFGLGMLTLGFVTNHIPSASFVKANIILNEILIQSTPPLVNEEEVIETKNFIIKKKWQKYSSDFIHLSIRAYSHDGKLIIEKNELFNIP